MLVFIRYFSKSIHSFKIQTQQIVGKLVLLTLFVSVGLLSTNCNNESSSDFTIWSSLLGNSDSGTEGLGMSAHESTFEDIYHPTYGNKRVRDSLNGPNESIDAWTGMLSLNYDDIEIAGTAGHNIKVGRSYLAQNWRDYQESSHPYGKNWRFDFGRVRTDGINNPCTHQSGEANDNPVFEARDGSNQTLYMGSSESTKERWKAVCTNYSGLGTGYSYNGMKITDTKGTIYDCGFYESGSGADITLWWNCHKITDKHGNSITINWDNSYGVALIRSITSSDGRNVAFNYWNDGTASVLLNSIVSNGQTWTFSFAEIGGHSVLTDVKRPDNLHHKYQYGSTMGDQFRLMNKRTEPYNGAITYLYEKRDIAKNAMIGNAYIDSIKQKKTISGVQSLGTWDFSYTKGSSYDTTYVSTPVNKLEYQHFGNQAANSGSIWKIGLLLKKYTKTTGGTTKLTETYSWDKQTISSEQIYLSSIGGVDYDIWAPILIQKIKAQDNSTFTTQNSSFDNYGSPQTVTETGPSGSRTTYYTFYNNTSNWVIKKIDKETISGISGSVNRTFTSKGEVATKDSYGSVQTFSYHSNGNLYSSKNANNVTTYLSNYYRGKARTIDKPDGIYIYRGVNNEGTIDWQDDGRGNRTYFNYDNMNRLTKVNFPIGNDANINWSSTGYSINHGGHTKTIVFDGFGRIKKITDAGIVTNSTYDAIGRMSFQSYPGSSNGLATSYDALGRVTSIDKPGSVSIDYSYNSNKITKTNERNKTWVTYYQMYGDSITENITDIKTPTQSGNIDVNRNKLGLITSVVKGGKTRSYGYNSRWQLTSINNPETGTTSYGRDNVGNLTSKKVGSASTNYYYYDGNNRLQSINYAGSTPDVTYTYDDHSNLTKVDNGVERTFSYNANNKRTNEKIKIDGLTFPIYYGYNTRGSLSSITYPSTQVVDYAPDDLGRPTKVGPYVTNVSWHPSGQPSSVSYQNGQVSTTTLTSRQRINQLNTKLGATYVTKLNYDYDSGDNTIAIHNQFYSPYNQTMSYDSRNRLTSSGGIWGSGSTSYNDAGDITSYNLGSNSKSYSYSGSKLSSVNGNSITYDNRGNMTSYNGFNYSFNDASQMINANGTSYAYDGGGTLVRKTINGIKNYIVYAYQDSSLLGEYNNTGIPVREYVYLGDRLVNMAYRTGLPEPSTVTNATPIEFAYLHFDAQGSTVAATDSLGIAIGYEGYEPYGEKTINGNGAGLLSVYYAGKHYDSNAQLVYMNARWFHSGLGRFVSTDPVQFNQNNFHSFNRYAYASNNPYKFDDPDGRESRDRNAPSLSRGIATFLDRGLSHFERSSVVHEVRAIVHEPAVQKAIKTVIVGPLEFVGKASSGPVSISSKDISAGPVKINFDGSVEVGYKVKKAGVEVGVTLNSRDGLSSSAEVGYGIGDTFAKAKKSFKVTSTEFRRKIRKAVRQIRRKRR